MTQEENCSKCGKSEPLADFEEQRLCYDCWHAAREATPPYHVVSKSNPALYSHCAWRPAVYTFAEATERAAILAEHPEYADKASR